MAREWESWLQTAARPASATEEADRDRTLELKVLCSINDAHASLTKPTLQAVLFEGLPDERVQHDGFAGRFHFGAMTTIHYAAKPSASRQNARGGISSIPSRENAVRNGEHTRECSGRCPRRSA